MINYFFILFIKFYQRLISPLFSPTCRFTPTCSSYSIAALKKYNFFKALTFIFKRVLNCHPWGGSGYDPLP
ncbi:MAG: membrane protein insertion efficiency factor YidD [Flavobacteriales bacterium TMED288]|nr:membrane protein insertion efficiency factor YidD [Flavobacteriales bacterium]RPG53041.1 MAG: membrane protein insertion efficiency factor YidD [Flavobacteriales bacterium TMED288]